MSNHSTNETSDDDIAADFRFISTAILTGLGCLGAILNICVIRYSLKLRSITGDLTHSFVLSMAVADLILCCIAQPAEFVIECITRAHLGAIPDWICRIQHMSNWLGYSASGLSLTLLNLDKLVFFKWPLHYGAIDAEKTALYSVSISWLVCCVGTVPMIVPGILQVEWDCATTGVSHGLYIFYTIAFSLLPILSSALVSAYLAHLVSKMRRRRGQYQSTAMSDSNIQQRLRAMAYIFITTAWTFAALSPFRLFNILRLYYFEDWTSDPIVYESITWMATVFFLMLSLNPSVDPCITLLTYAPYRNLMRMDMKSLKKFALHYSCKPCNSEKQNSEWV